MGGERGGGEGEEEEEDLSIVRHISNLENLASLMPEMDQFVRGEIKQLSILSESQGFLDPSPEARVCVCVCVCVCVNVQFADAGIV